ncbi:hypothetical protein L1S32_10745 [Methanogenium sp. S4BF]|uniref:hypothetical protein n=1 Tax=Methanogenium sp. S4BF TaxID=1789226 RepID=UPI0024165D49|nr:hypothetical protein [Methanogenium sp. S4BF]WFN34304.1 hypothetical protein L1S32_10745 [Methanogenium sp. S4BF]
MRSTFDYRNKTWKRARRYGRVGLTIGICAGIIPEVIILAYASLAPPEAFAGTAGSQYVVFIGLPYMIQPVIGRFFGGQIQGSIRGYIARTT